MRFQRTWDNTICLKYILNSLIVWRQYSTIKIRLSRRKEESKKSLSWDLNIEPRFVESYSRYIRSKGRSIHTSTLIFDMLPCIHIHYVPWDSSQEFPSLTREKEVKGVDDGINYYSTRTLTFSVGYLGPSYSDTSRYRRDLEELVVCLFI